MTTPMSGTDGQTGIRVQTKFFPLAFLLLFFKPWLSVDGAQPTKVSWGETFYPTGPGHHKVRAYVPYLYMRHMGDSTIDVDVAPGAVVSARWRAPLVIFLKGKWTAS